MNSDSNSRFGQIISRLTTREHLSEQESYDAFSMLLNNEVSEMQQGAFLAALTTKGETAAEVAGGWRAVYELDTAKVQVTCSNEIVDNCGTGMDSCKTFNISTAASIVAAAGGVKIARHGARAITSVCGTVDMAESLGVDVDCEPELVARSIEQAGLGLFNGMSPTVHPTALGRILSQIRFGSPLNIAASLANPALPRIGVRGVYAQELLEPVAAVMDSIGYLHAFVLFGSVQGSDKGMDEASVCGTTHVIQLDNGSLTRFTIEPEECGLVKHPAAQLAPENDREEAARQLVALLSGHGKPAQRDAVLLNSAFLFNVRQMTGSLREGVDLAREILANGKAIELLEHWVRSQNRTPDAGLKRLNRLRQRVLQ